MGDGVMSKTALRMVVLGGAALALIGCQNFREATGVAKLAPDEFTILTKAPLIIPPDYNLRPPMPGAPDRNQGAPADMARQALFANPQAAAAALGPNYSDSEKNLLAKSGGAAADSEIRSAISADSGYADQGAGFADRVLFQGPGTAAPAAPPAPAVAAPAPQAEAAPAPAAVAGGTAKGPAPAAPAAAATPPVRGTTE
jgi:hypothetical protein